MNDWDITNYEARANQDGVASEPCAQGQGGLANHPVHVGAFTDDVFVQDTVTQSRSHFEKQVDR